MNAKVIDYCSDGERGALGAREGGLQLEEKEPSDWLCCRHILSYTNFYLKHTIYMHTMKPSASELVIFAIYMWLDTYVTSRCSCSRLMTSITLSSDMQYHPEVPVKAYKSSSIVNVSRILQ